MKMSRLIQTAALKAEIKMKSWSGTWDIQKKDT